MEYKLLLNYLMEVILSLGEDKLVLQYLKSICVI